MLDLFFRCLDDRTARDLRLADTGASSSAVPSQVAKAAPLGSPVDNPTGIVDKPVSMNDTDALPLSPQTISSAAPPDDSLVNMDWYELFNLEGDDFSGLAGSLTNPDYLNPQNLEFLYRFL